LTSAAAENNAKNGKRYDDSALMTAAHILIDHRTSILANGEVDTPVA
jgi:hypothetical protein